jgi:hypothetical protein
MASAPLLALGTAAPCDASAENPLPLIALLIKPEMTFAFEEERAIVIETKENELNSSRNFCFLLLFLKETLCSSREKQRVTLSFFFLDSLLKVAKTCEERR